MSDVHQSLERYARAGHKYVSGWLLDAAIQGLIDIDRVQKTENVQGAIGEIGVHHGCLFILLHHLRREAEVSVAVDLFEYQDENLDGSGKGNLSVFLENCERNNCDLSKIVHKSANSMKLNSTELLELAGETFRIISVDGGHTSDITKNDLELVSACLSDGGVVVLDDVYNESWPGVADGLHRYLNEAKRSLIPFAVFGNKLLLTNNDNKLLQYSQGLSQLSEQLDGYKYKMVEAFQTELLVFTFTNKSGRHKLVNSIRKTQSWQRLEQSRYWTTIFPSLSRLRKRFLGEN